MSVRSTGLSYAMFLLLVMACGKDSPAADGGNTAGGKAGAAGAAGKAAGVPCGAKVCKAPVGYTGESCCQDSFSGVCGQKSTATDCRPFPPQPAPNCPDGTIVQNVGAMLARGCCLADMNVCGLDLTGFGTYCSPLSDAQIFLEIAPDGGTASTFIPPATNCDGTPSM